MVDNLHARFRLKIAADGLLLIDAILALGPLQVQVENALSAIKVPQLDLAILSRYRGGQMLTYDIGINDAAVHIEIEVLSSPGEQPKRVKPQIDG